MGGADVYRKVPDGPPISSGGAPVTYASAEAIPAASGGGPPLVAAENHPAQEGRYDEAPVPELAGEAACAAVAGGHGTFGRTPMQIGCCPHCKTVNARTRVRTHPHWKSWVAVGALAVIFWPLFWIPLVMDEMKQTNHYCSSCGAKVGEIGPFEDCCVTTAE